jgi:hypothetical protein
MLGTASLLLIIRLRLRIGIDESRIAAKNCEVMMSEVTILSVVEIAWPQAKGNNY